MPSNKNKYERVSVCVCVASKKLPKTSEGCYRNRKVPQRIRDMRRANTQCVYCYIISTGIAFSNAGFCLSKSPIFSDVESAERKQLNVQGNFSNFNIYS